MKGIISMDMDRMQEMVDEYINQFEVGYFSPLVMMARVTEEVGELAREINHFYGEKQKKRTEEVKEEYEEFGDVLFIIICMANSLDIDLTEAFKKTMEKYQIRDKYRFKRKDEQDID